MARMRLGVLGGTFDPVHLGHLILAEEAREQVGLSEVLFVPAGDPWRKADRAVTPAAHRVAMLRRALEGNPQFCLSLMEVERPGPTYTVDTLRALAEERRGWEIFFLMGLDALLDLPNWRDPQGIVSAARLVVAGRPGVGRADLVEMERRIPGLAARISWLEMPKVDISASDIRSRVRRGRSIRYLVPPGVAEYIEAHGLYREGCSEG